MHAHLQLQFQKAIKCTAQFFSWEGRCLNATANNYLGDGLIHKPANYQQSVDRTFFYMMQRKKARNGTLKAKTVLMEITFQHGCRETEQHG